MKRLCTICARGGSKGLPKKNIRLLLGKPLIVHSIEHAKQSGLFEHIAVSSDSLEIREASQIAGITDIIERPAELATDGAGKVPAIRHALATMEARHGCAYDTLVDLDVTSPLRTADDILGAVRLLEESGATSVITGAPSRRSPYFNLVETLPDGSVTTSKTPNVEVLRRQDAPRTYDMNASIYVWKTSIFRSDPRTFYPDTRLFEMLPERSHDIDDEIDFAFVELLLRKRSGIKPSARRFDLTGKTAVVTGGAGILGRHFTRGLAAHGAAVAIIDLDSKAVEAQADLLRRECGVSTIGLCCDITDGGAVRTAVDRIEHKLGAIDILHNNAASKGKSLDAFFASVEDYDMATWRDVMAVNLDAMFLVAREVGLRMAARRNGSIIQTSSIYGIMGPRPAYL